MTSEILSSPLLVAELTDSDCGRNANNKPRPLRLKLVPDAAGFYKATFQCFVKVIPVSDSCASVDCASECAV